MAEEFNNKDYGDYFSAIEKRIEKQNTPSVKAAETIAKTNNKKVYGAVLRLRPWVYVAAAVIVVAIILLIALPPKAKAEQERVNKNSNNVTDVEPEQQAVNNFAEYTNNTEQIAADIVSENIIFINCNTNEVVAARNATARCFSASTTKIMTVLTAADYITDYNKTFTFSYEITDPFYQQEATMAGFADGEAVNMTDLLYGAILPSGADATAGLAISIAGSEQEFVKLMNAKAEELGLRDTHFVNASGLYDTNHYSTPEDMAVIIRAAMKNELLRKILSTYEYTTAPTAQNPNGILLTSTLFKRMYGTEPEGSDIIGGKTGFINESGYCIASFGKSESATGTEYVCVAFKGPSVWPAVYDQINLYTRYAK